MIERDPRNLFATPDIELVRREDGTMILRSRAPLLPYARCLGEHLVHWSSAAPERLFLLERDLNGDWVHVSYGDALRRVEHLATGLLRHGLSIERPLLILSDNSIDHALLSLAAMHVGIPVVPVSSAYSLVSKDHAKLRGIVSSVAPGMIYASDASRYAKAIEAVRQISQAEFVSSLPDGGPPGVLSISSLEQSVDAQAVASAFSSVGPETVAKLLFTSGSTDEPKGVLNTQRMLCSNQQARAQLWPCLAAAPAVLLDWLPWSHTFGGNFNFNAVLMHGGTLYIDEGRPVPALFERTIRNIHDVRPTMYFNVPRGYDMLVSALQADKRLRESFFSRLQIIFCAAAALPQNLWDELRKLAVETVGTPVPLVSAWGSTETSPLATDCHFQAARTGVIGVPIPGTELKLLPNGGKLEVRVRGPNVTPGYWKRPDLTASHFDEEKFYKIGDAVRLVDASAPEKGLMFDGRVSEDFKLDSGTWVNVGMLRVRAISALAPIAQDLVLTGHDRSSIGFLIFPNIAACRQLCPDVGDEIPVQELLRDRRIVNRVLEGMQALKTEGQGSSTFASRAMLLIEPPSIDAGEITDKGYINQRAVLSRRAALVEKLYSSSSAADVIDLNA